MCNLYVFNYRRYSKYYFKVSYYFLVFRSYNKTVKSRIIPNHLNGDVNLVLEFERDRILRDYIKLDNTDDLFESDILILPSDRKDGFKSSQPICMKETHPELIIKYYAYDQEKIQYSSFS